MKNGRDEQYDDPKIASLSAARKEKAAAAAKKGGISVLPNRGIGELLFGALIIAMALGMLVWWTRPLWQSAVTVSK